VSEAQRFEISVSRWIGPLLVIFLGATRPRRWAAVSKESIQVRMGFGFSARIERATITKAELDTRLVTSWGVHGWRGRWLVNGGSRGMVSLQVDPRQEAKVFGFGVKLSALRLSMENPQGLLLALGT